MSAVPTTAQAITQLLAGAWLAQAIAVIAKLGVADLLSAGPRRWVWQSVGGLEHSLRTGVPAFEQIFGTSLFDYYAAHPDAARVGAEGLKSVGRGQDAAVAAAYDYAGAGTVVDVGGGQGGLLSAILAANPEPGAFCSTFPM